LCVSGYWVGVGMSTLRNSHGWIRFENGSLFDNQSWVPLRSAPAVVVSV